MGHSDIRMMTASPACSSCLSLPSKEHHICDRLSAGTWEHGMCMQHVLSERVSVSACYRQLCSQKEWVAHLDAEMHMVWEDERPEGERMRADGREEDAWDLGVKHGAAGCEVVSGRAGRGGDDEPIALYDVEKKHRRGGRRGFEAGSGRGRLRRWGLREG
jgi:hypothetical protein